MCGTKITDRNPGDKAVIAAAVSRQWSVVRCGLASDRRTIWTHAAPCRCDPPPHSAFRIPDSELECGNALPHFGGPVRRRRPGESGSVPAVVAAAGATWEGARKCATMTAILHVHAQRKK